MRIKALIIISLYCLLASCLQEPDLSFYDLPLDTLSIPSDPMNELTMDKIYLGKGLFIDKSLSATGQISCGNCHDPEKNFEAPLRADGVSMVGGCGEGFRLDSGLLVKMQGYEGKEDCMDWVKSTAAVNSAYNQISGLSGRFGGTDNEFLRADKIRHFGLILSKELEEKLFKCHATLFQAFVALAGHRQFFVDRLFDRPELISKLEIMFDKKIIKGVTDPNEMAFMVACCLDAYQRSILRSNTKFRHFARSQVQLSDQEMLGWQLAKDNCIKCHTSPTFSGDIEISRFVNLPNVPDAANDITTVGIFGDFTYRKVPTMNPDNSLYGPHGEFDSFANYIPVHYPFLNQAEAQAIEAWFNTL